MHRARSLSQEAVVRTARHSARSSPPRVSKDYLCDHIYSLNPYSLSSEQLLVAGRAYCSNPASPIRRTKITPISRFLFTRVPRRVTISTVGLVPLIDRLRRENLGVRLAVSLVAAIPEKRASLMPVEKLCPLPSLLESAHRFAHTSGLPVTFEYVLLSEVNDGEEDAKALITRLSPIPCKVNLIPFNQVETLPFEPPPEKRVDRFLSLLAPHLTVTVRRSAGGSIDAACGQLRLRREGAS